MGTQPPQTQTNFVDSDGVDLGEKLITKDYLLSTYQSIVEPNFLTPELWGWGNGSNGRLGNNSGVITTTPVTTSSGGANWKQVSCGYDFTAAVKTDGTLWTWGNGIYMQLGIAERNNVSKLTPVTTFAGGTNWRSVSCGHRYALATKTDGTLWSWGNNNLGQLGRPTNTPTPVTTFSGGTDWAYIPTGDVGISTDYFTISTSSGSLGSHTAAIKTDGSLWVWGANAFGQCGNGLSGISLTTPTTAFGGGTTWKLISCGFNHTVAVKTDGTLWVWGNGGLGQLGTNSTLSSATPVTTFAGGTDWKQASAGGNFTAAVKTDGTLWSWGNNADVQLGINNAATRTTPVTTFAGGTNWKQVVCSLRHTAAIKTDGTLWTWGNGYALGNNNSLRRSTPITTFAGGTNWKQVSVSSLATAAVKTDGTLWTWGNSNSAQLGTNGGATRLTPVTTFAGGTNWDIVSVGNDQPKMVALKTDGTLWTWGNTMDGGLGNNVRFSVRSTPVTTFAGGTNWKMISTGYNVLAVKDDNTLWTWGPSFLGSGVLFFDNAVPQQEFSSSTWNSVSAGFNHSGAIRTDGTLWMWGDNASYSRLGSNNNVTRTTPATTFAGGTNWKQVSCGRNHTAAVKTDGTLWVWGNASEGATARSGNTNTPATTFAGGTNWRTVSCGYRHTLATKTDGTLWTWGNNSYRQLGRYTVPLTPVTTFAGGTDWAYIPTGDVGISTDYFTIATEAFGVRAIKTDGTLWTWGQGGSGRLGNNATTTRSTPVTTFAGGINWKSISCGGENHTAAIKTDGTLWTWGYATYGKLGINNPGFTQVRTPITTFAGGTDWKQVSCGYRHTAAVKTDGTLWVWGLNTNVQLGTNDAVIKSTPVTTFAGGTDWKQVSCGFRNTAAVKTDGTLWTWGNGGYSQIGNNVGANRSTPVTTFAGGTNWKQVSCGRDIMGAVKTDGTLWMWGGGAGLGSQITSRTTPVTTFAGGTNWDQISVGVGGAAAIKTDGTLWLWGNNNDGQLGNNSSGTFPTPVTTFLGGTNWKVVSYPNSAGNNTTVAAVKSDNTLWVWGNNQGLGINDLVTINLVRQEATTSSNWKTSITGATSLHSAAVKTDGTLWVWGNGAEGRLGNNDTNNATTPVTTFAGGTNWKSVACGRRHTSAIKSIDFL